jgi:hypothetical protein
MVTLATSARLTWKHSQPDLCKLSTEMGQDHTADIEVSRANSRNKNYSAATGADAASRADDSDQADCSNHEVESWQTARIPHSSPTMTE